MSICHTCAAWCALTQRQLDIRLENMANEPDPTPFPCPRCGGIEWATTDKMVNSDPTSPPPVRPWWKFW